MLTTIIEKYLAGVDQATFQKLMNHLLYLEGYKFLGSPGSVVGKNKTSKGCPDSFFEFGDKYVFCEMTTQEKLATGETFFKKLNKDIEHCFNVSVTGIAKAEISKVILCFTEKLTPEEHKELKGEVNKNNPYATLVSYSIQEIPFRLVYYPGLADKYIAGVKTTKGTLYTLPDFLKITEKGLQPSLTNPFVGREDEVKKSKEYLLSNDILVITGSQGLGKSKLAVHLAELFESEFSFEPRVVAGSPVPLWEDLSNFILPYKKYFIFFDDANKALPNLDYLLQFVASRDKDTTKIVITVRDYVKKDLNKYINDVPHSEITINPLEDKKILEIVTKSLSKGLSLDPFTIEKIISLSKGNSRLALMATSTIIKDKNFEVLTDVFSLYDKYFQKVKNDLSFLNDEEYLKTLGIISFFGVLDRKNEEINTILESKFNIKRNKFWETVLELEKVELVDVFQKEAVKISDQVLGTYVFYKTFIDENKAQLNYSEWLFSFIDKYEKKISKTLIDLINTFGFIELRDRITTLILEVQKKLEEDTKNLYKFLEIFWFYREVDSLVFVKRWIGGLEEEETELSDIKYSYESNDFVWAPDVFKLLLNFWKYNTPYTKEAIDLAIKLMFRQPSRIPETLKHLNENLQYHRFDYKVGFPRQLLLLEALDNPTFCVREKAISDQLFLSLAPKYFGWEFSQTEGKGGGQMMIYNFHLVKTPALMELRKNILERLFVLFLTNESKVLKVLHKYAWTSKDIDSSIYSDERPLITEFINKNLNTENYSHCSFVYEYVGTLKEHNVSSSTNWSIFLDSDSLQIAKIFSSRFDDEKFKYDKKESKLKKDIENYVHGKGFEFIRETLDVLESVYKDAFANNDGYWIESSVPLLFLSLAETDTDLYYKSLKLLMLGEYSFEFNGYVFIYKPIRTKLVKPREIYTHINKYEYKQKQFWKQLFFEALDESDVDEFFLLEFIEFISSLRNRFYIYDLERKIIFDRQFKVSKALLHPSATDHENVITYITEVLLSNECLDDLSFGHDTCEKSCQFFTKKAGLLKLIFYKHIKSGYISDSNGKEMEAICSLDNYFFIEYLKELIKDGSFSSFHFDNFNVTFVWDLPQYEEIIDEALQIIISKAPIFSNFEHQANVLFKGLELGTELQEKVYNYISRFIRRNFSSKQHIHIILNVVTYSFNSQVLRFLREFLLLNKNIEFMSDLWLERSDAFSGSRVPRIDGHIEFTKSIIETIQLLPNQLDYADHIKYMEREIEWAKQDKQYEMKRDFTGFGD